ncbi:hypothetical protein K474DRAFT_1673758 [Panus rudis PR-1116 ss-1]|nr:hypothetical protein K474DRAFT_1673758 [Panus rudis PR-1116 ss-1]
MAKVDQDEVPSDPPDIEDVALSRLSSSIPLERNAGVWHFTWQSRSGGHLLPALLPNPKQNAVGRVHLLILLGLEHPVLATLGPPLMIYHRLLSKLLVPSNRPGGFDFQALWSLLEVESTAVLCSNFRAWASGVAARPSTSMTCLNDLVRIWRECVEALHLVGVSNMLTIEYVPQAGVQQEQKKRNYRRLFTRPLKEEEEEMIRAIAAKPEFERFSLGDTDIFVDMIGEGGETRFTAATDGTRSAVEVQMTWTIQKLLVDHAYMIPNILKLAITLRSRSPSPVPPFASNDDSGEPTTSQNRTRRQRPRIIGKKKSAMVWWDGKRAPRGVDIAFTRRCITCPYVKGCEWRAKQAGMVPNIATGSASSSH